MTLSPKGITGWFGGLLFIFHLWFKLLAWLGLVMNQISKCYNIFLQLKAQIPVLKKAYLDEQAAHNELKVNNFDYNFNQKSVWVISKLGTNWIRCANLHKAWFAITMAKQVSGHLFSPGHVPLHNGLSDCHVCIQTGSCTTDVGRVIRK